jgi:hypothetical protein
MLIETFKARLGLPVAEQDGASFSARWVGARVQGLLSTEDGILVGDVTYHGDDGTETLASIRGRIVGDRFDIEDELAADDFALVVADLTLADFSVIA